MIIASTMNSGNRNGIVDRTIASKLTFATLAVT